MKILGISAYYHDSAACLLINGNIVAAAQEERFTRKKHDPAFPVNAIRYCLDSSNIGFSEIDYVVYYDKPFLTFERLLETYFAFAPQGLKSFLKAMPIWLKDKLFLKNKLQEELHSAFGDAKRTILFSEHHLSHAASAFYPSPFNSAAVLCMDGVGEWATTSAWLGNGSDLKPLWEIKFPHSLGLLYSAFTYFCGFKVNSGEYKLMGLAPYGTPKYKQAILDHLVDIKKDGSFRLNLDFFEFHTGLKMTSKRFDSIFDGPPRKAEGPLTQREMDLARSVQEVIEEIVLTLGRSLYRETGSTHLCLAGGVALNCVSNGRLLRESSFQEIWVQPAAGDAGGAIGAALALWHQYCGQPRAPVHPDSMSGAYLGPSFSSETIREFISDQSIPAHEFSKEEHLFDRVAQELASGKVVGWFQGRMEFGPRSLGNRSILGDPRSSEMQSTMNLKIKFRESFRPFAPAVLREKVSDYFEFNKDSPYMLMVAPVKNSRRRPLNNSQKTLWGIELLNVPKSDIPAVTHIDYSSRIQTVHKETNPKFYKLIETFNRHTGCPILVNTSFNVRGEPIVCSHKDAYRCFMRTEMDILVMENFVLFKTEQHALEGDSNWKTEFELD